jgi:bifunctional non-homologous end joining protein LigD
MPAPFATVPRAYQRGARWAEPRLVAEVTFTTWTADHLLRHPSFEGLREDKPAREVKFERSSHKRSRQWMTSTRHDHRLILQASMPVATREVSVKHSTRSGLISPGHTTAAFSIQSVASRSSRLWLD